MLRIWRGIRRRGQAVVLGSAAVAVVSGLSGCATASAHPDGTLPAGRINHVVVIDLENQGFEATFGSGSPMHYLNDVLRRQGELVENYYAIGHVSLDNYIAQVSGQAPTRQTQVDCLANAATVVDLTPGSPAADGQVTGQGCVYPTAVETIAAQLDARYPPNAETGRAPWRAYEQDMGNNLTRDGGTADPSGGGVCGHPPIGGRAAVVATPTDQYVTRHNPFVWFHSVIDQQSLCDANDVPLGTLAANGQPNPGGHLVSDFSNTSSTPRFAFITPNLCDDGHDDVCIGVNSDGTHQGGLVGADSFLSHWMPVILDSPAYREGDTLVVITFDESDVGDTSACCNEQPGPNTTAAGSADATSADAAPGGGRIGALLLSPKYIEAGSTNSVGSYNHYSALRTYEDLLGLTTGGSDGKGHLGFAGASELKPFGTDVFNK